MKTLYLSDLDGTLLRSETRVSDYTADVINRFVQDGGVFTYATARSFESMLAVTDRLPTGFPVICYNGVFIYDTITKQVLVMNHYTNDEFAFARELFHARGIVPAVFAYIDGRERLSYIERHVNPDMRIFLDSRRGDPRLLEVETADELFSGKVFRIVCVDMNASYSDMNSILRSDGRFADNVFINIYQRDGLFANPHMCDIIPAKASKGHAALQLKAMLGCDRLAAFGDERNDVPLFCVADESYATSNAIAELKGIATAVIDSNDEDGVARWIERNAVVSGE